MSAQRKGSSALSVTFTVRTVRSQAGVGQPDAVNDRHFVCRAISLHHCRTQSLKKTYGVSLGVIFWGPEPGDRTRLIAPGGADGTVESCVITNTITNSIRYRY